MRGNSRRHRGAAMHQRLIFERHNSFSEKAAPMGLETRPLCHEMSDVFEIIRVSMALFVALKIHQKRVVEGLAQAEDKARFRQHGGDLCE